jgi:predicted metal-dependent phosphotriesterase family hydrolase
MATLQVYSSQDRGVCSASPRLTSIHHHGGPSADTQLALQCIDQGTYLQYDIITKLTSQDHYDPQQTYQDPNRTYHDVANALAQYPSLSPRTDVYSE